LSKGQKISPSGMMGSLPKLTAYLWKWYIRYLSRVIYDTNLKY